MTLLQFRAVLDKRLGRQYNADADSQAMLDFYLNSACRYCWDGQPLGFNEVSIESDATNWPTISEDQFTLPTAAQSLMDLKISIGTGSANYETDVDWTQSGRIITIANTGVTPTRMVYHSFYTDITTTSDSLSSYIPDYLIIELAAYFASGESKAQGDQSPIQINKAMDWYDNWLRKFSIRRAGGASTPYHADGQRIDRRGGIYTAGDLESARSADDTKGIA